MKNTMILILIVSLLMAGCDKNIDNHADESVAGSSEVLAIVDETAPPESTVTEISETITNEKPSFEHDWQVLYYDELAENIDNPMAMFNIYDLDGDGTPELLLSEGSFHAASGSLYTVCQGKLIYLGDYGGWGEFQYDFERNYINSSFWQMGSGWLTIYSFKNGEAAKIVSLYVYVGGSFSTMPDDEYKINDEEVSEEIFNAEYEKYYFDVQEDFIVRKYDATQSTIEHVLRQY